MTDQDKRCGGEAACDWATTVRKNGPWNAYCRRSAEGNDYVVCENWSSGETERWTMIRRNGEWFACTATASIAVPVLTWGPFGPITEPQGEAHATVTMSDEWDGIGGADESDY